MILLVAIAGGIGTAFAKAQLQTTFPTQNRLEQATGLPVLGSVREIFTAEALAGHRQRLKWFVGAGGALAASYALLLLVELWQRSTVACGADMTHKNAIKTGDRKSGGSGKRGAVR